MNTVFTVGKELGSILLHHWIKRYPHLLSTRIRIHVVDSKLSTLESGFKTVRISTGCVWTDGRLGKNTLRIQKYPDTCGRGL